MSVTKQLFVYIYCKVIFYVALFTLFYSSAFGGRCEEKTKDLATVTLTIESKSGVIDAWNLNAQAIHILSASNLT